MYGGVTHCQVMVFYYDQLEQYLHSVGYKANLEANVMIGAVTGINVDPYKSSNPTSQFQAGQAESGTTNLFSGATNITLSDAAKQTLQVKNIKLVADDAQANMDKLLKDAGKESPVRDGKLDVDLSGFDRRELFAISVNEGNGFPVDQQKGAQLELERRFDQVVSTALAVSRVTSDFKELYETALAHLEKAGSEERTSTAWFEQKEAVDKALTQLSTKPTELPEGIENDPVAARIDEGDNPDKRRDFGDVASDARAALDKQIATAKTAGRDLNFSTSRRSDHSVDFSNFDTRSLSAIAQNAGGEFDRLEMHAARMEVHSRSGQAILAAFRNAQENGGPTTFAKNIIAQYASMSSEERETAGWSQDFYEGVVKNYQTTSKVVSMLSAALEQANSSFGRFG